MTATWHKWPEEPAPISQALLVYTEEGDILVGWKPKNEPRRWFTYAQEERYGELVLVTHWAELPAPPECCIDSRTCQHCGAAVVHPDDGLAVEVDGDRVAWCDVCVRDVFGEEPDFDKVYEFFPCIDCGGYNIVEQTCMDCALKDEAATIARDGGHHIGLWTQDDREWWAKCPCGGYVSIMPDEPEGLQIGGDIINDPCPIHQQEKIA